MERSGSTRPQRDYSVGTASNQYNRWNQAGLSQRTSERHAADVDLILTLIGDVQFVGRRVERKTLHLSGPAAWSGDGAADRKSRPVEDSDLTRRVAGKEKTIPISQRAAIPARRNK